MSMTSALSIASSGLANINAQMGLLSQNIANAATPGYATEIGSQQDVTAGGIGMGVRSGLPSLAIDRTLLATVIQQNATVSGLQTTQTALQAIDSVLGTPGQGTDLGSLLGNLRNSFSALANEPANQTRQSAVAAAASTLAQGINGLGAAYTAQRQSAQNDLQGAVATLGDSLGSIGRLSSQIIAGKAAGQSTVDLENQREAAVQTVSALVSIRTTRQPNGDLSVFTPAGLALPTAEGATVFAIGPGSTAPGAFYPGGGLSGITLNGADVTNQLAGGRIGADITLRDATLPTSQSQLDEFAHGLGTRFAQQGLALFTDGSGALPSGGGVPVQAGYVGFSAVIQVNPAVTANPGLVRDGTDAIIASPGGATDFSPNPAGGPAGFSGLIARIINFTFGSQVQSGVAQPGLNSVGLGASGDLTAPFLATGSLTDFAVNMVAAQARQSATVSSDLTTESAVQGALTAKMAAKSGVNMDTELSHMLTLQNAYGANARIINVLQQMFTQLLNAVQ